MPFKLTKDELRTRTQLIDDLNIAATAIDQAVATYNDQIEGLRPPVEIAVTKYNELVSKARDLCIQVAGQADQDLGDKSEDWMETERGIAAQSWQESWDNVELDDVDYQWPDDLEITIPDYPDDLKDLPEEADEA
jgi:hypothetical protein